MNELSRGVVTARLARPTRDLAAVRQFYVQVLGLEVLGGFEAHAGYDGCFVGVSGADWHLEFTHHVSGQPVPQPTNEDLLVLYVEPDAFADILRRLKRFDVAIVGHENPYWSGVGALTITDPDGYLVVLCPART